MNVLHKIRDFCIRKLNFTPMEGLEVVFGDKEAPGQDPNQGTRYWTARTANNLTHRLYWLMAVTGVLFAVLLFQLWELQITRGSGLALQGRYNSLSDKPLFAARGAILDTEGKELAWSENATGTPHQTRTYATTSGIGHILGYVSYPQKDASGNYYKTKMNGLSGIERGYDSLLSATPGRKIFETNAARQVISESVVSRAQPGKDLQLSIDVGTQQKLFSLIERTAQERGFTGGAGVLMDVDTGQLIAAASYPGFDPNRVTKNSDYFQNLQSATTSPFLNRVSEGRFTPGSVIKPFIAAAALNEEIVSPETTIVSTGELRVQNPYQPDQYTVFEDWKAHGPVSMTEAIAVSSNVYFYEIGGGFEDQQGLGIDNIARYSRGFGLGEKTGIDGLSETTGVIPTPEWKANNFSDQTWRVGDTYNTAIGQYGFQITPLQMVRGIAGIANNGQLPTPTLLDGVSGAKETVEPRIPRSTYDVVKRGMRLAVSSSKGTAHNLDVDFTDVAAKTGTAELGGKESGVNSWVIGFYPFDDPQYAFTIVMADGPRSNVVGGVYVMRRLLEWMHDNESPYVPSS